LGSIRNHFNHHPRFYSALIVGIAVFLLGRSLQPQLRLVAAGDAFFAVYLVLVGIVVGRLSPADLRERAAHEDEGILIVVLVVLAVIAVSSLAIIQVIRDKNGAPPIPLALALAGVPLGWLTLHVIAAFHYADLYYVPNEDPQCARSLDFKHTSEPGIWDFFYYSFTIGMTAQTSDTDVLDTKMRRATLGHSIVSFFYYTAIIAMAVNAVVAIAS
jgi:uncharacterized membrane protein